MNLEKVMKVNGNLLMAFYQEWPFGSDWYQEEANQECYGGPEDELLLIPTQSYDLDDTLGNIRYQGDVHNIKPTLNGKLVAVSQEGGYREPELNLQAYFKAWNKDRTTTDAVVTVPKGDLDAFKALCKEHGWKVTL